LPTIAQAVTLQHVKVPIFLDGIELDTPDRWSSDLADELGARAIVASQCSLPR